jgi:hypothetical protein
MVVAWQVRLFIFGHDTRPDYLLAKWPLADYLYFHRRPGYATNDLPKVNAFFSAKCQSFTLRIIEHIFVSRMVGPCELPVILSHRKPVMLIFAVILVG